MTRKALSKALFLLSLLSLAAVCWSDDAFASEETYSWLRAPHSASLLQGVELDGSLRPSASPPLRITDALRLGHAAIPRLDRGGALDEGSRQVFAMTMGFLVGFGVGHLIAHDPNGFALFLIIDITLLTGAIVLDVLFEGPFAVIGIATLVVSHIVQGLDAFRQAGGEPIIEKDSVRSGDRSSERSLLPTRRVLGWAF